MSRGWSRRQRRRVLALLVVLSLLWYLCTRPRDDNWSGLLVTTPSNRTHPLHLVSLVHNPPVHRKWPSYATMGHVTPLALKSSSLSHIVQHDAGYIINNEVADGEIWKIKLDKSSVHQVAAVPSEGAAPAFSLVTRDRKHLITVNYNSPVVALHSLPNLALAQRLDLPSHDPSHPHHVVQHPHLDHVFYVPDLGRNILYMLHLGIGLTVVQELPVDCEGPRNSVINDNILYLSCQTSNTLVTIPLAANGAMLRPTAYHTTLPPSIETTSFSSHILLHDKTLFVANRQLTEPAPPLPATRVNRKHLSHHGKHFEHGTAAGGDTLAMYSLKPELHLLGHIELGCYRPREMLVVKGERDYLAVTCTGIGGVGAGAGVVLLDLFEGEVKVPQRSMESVRPATWPVVGRWSTEDEVWGIAPVI